ncbi:MAG: hypothetical protein ICV76_05135 [Nitrospiraceae bacterium]|nr:hypothetical protein [Nitrospiraceae bacterium]
MARCERLLRSDAKRSITARITIPTEKAKLTMVARSILSERLFKYAPSAVEPARVSHRQARRLLRQGGPLV